MGWPVGLFWRKTSEESSRDGHGRTQTTRAGLKLYFSKITVYWQRHLSKERKKMIISKRALSWLAPGPWWVVYTYKCKINSALPRPSFDH